MLVSYCRTPVECQFEIIGEALNRLAKNDAALTAGLPDTPRIVAFRNIPIHGYDVDNHVVWDVIQNNFVPLNSPNRRTSSSRSLGDIPSSLSDVGEGQGEGMPLTEPGLQALGGDFFICYATTMSMATSRRRRIPYEIQH